MNEAPASRTAEQSDQAEVDPFAGFPPARTLSLSRRAKILILLALAAGGILYLYMKFIAGDDGNQATPKKTVEGFFQAAVDKDAKEMVSYLLFTPGETMDGRDKETMVQNWEKMFEQQPAGTGIHDFEVVIVHEAEDTATVVSKVEVGAEEMQTGEVSYKLKKVEGKWFIDFFG
ncbi:DUF4878 domain-containing protein [Cohnella luojiensis]|uniref:DUF4878 domain-containing protein n=1 Tax=Cohnella luojiensis TaxID=652876 RepID=A0A4Y8LTF8_9BACL|nr:DUF4878 domain-containing protein [Cohnella luojiensis]TFE23691.1 DUF4878 domain-containing protein [Cohnella luojiensis]